MTPSTGVSANGSNVLSGRRMKSGFSRYPQFPLYSNLPWFNCIGTSLVWKLSDTIWHPAFQKICKHVHKKEEEVRLKGNKQTKTWYKGK
jgi:hypothetical protein